MPLHNAQHGKKLYCQMHPWYYLIWEPDTRVYFDGGTNTTHSCKYIPITALHLNPVLHNIQLNSISFHTAFLLPRVKYIWYVSVVLHLINRFLIVRVFNLNSYFVYV